LEGVKEIQTTMESDSSTEPARTRGRPKKPENEVHDALVEAATWAFLSMGYGDATVEIIAKRAGVAKKTIYRFASTKADLLGMVVRSWTDSYVRAIDIDPDSTTQFWASLEDILNLVAQRALSPEAVGIYRLLVGEGTRFPEMARIYNSNGIDRAISIISGWLDRQRSRGIVVLHDPNMATGLLLSMLIAEPLRQISLGLAPPMPGYDIRPRVEAVLDAVRSGLIKAP
jgi:AcrR family transcriptional regulator